MMVMHKENSNIKQYTNKKCRSMMVYQYFKIYGHDSCMHDNKIQDIYSSKACHRISFQWFNQNKLKTDFVELIWTQTFSSNSTNISQQMS
jgi:hypothetical protein